MKIVIELEGGYNEAAFKRAIENLTDDVKRTDFSTMLVFSTNSTCFNTVDDKVKENNDAYHIQNRISMKISIIHPTRHRLRQALDTQAKWLLNADNSVEYIFSFDSDDTTIPSYISGLRNPNMTAIEAINVAAKEATGNLLIVVSDDTDCFKGWDTELLRELDGKSDFLVKTQDGIQKTLITMPVMDRKYYERFGYIYHPEYLHMAADVELTAVGMMLGRVMQSSLLFRHLHYSAGLSPKDEINEKNDRTYEQGDVVLAKHLLNNFGIEKPVMEYQQIQWH
jgi:hypothetical protein